MMTELLAPDTVSEILVGMGFAAVTHSPKRLKAILGSCVGVAIYHPRLRSGGLAHVMLPSSVGHTGLPGKFADTAVTHLIGLLRKCDVPHDGLVAKVVGGANMFNTKGPLQIGEANVLAVIQSLQSANIRLIAKDVGGNAGRRVMLDCATGQLTVETANHSMLVL
jgi:chemotaxis protein CheD